MKNIYKRIFAIIMSLSMVASSTTVVSAKEIEENSNVVICGTSDENNDIVEMSSNGSLEQLTSIYSGVADRTAELVVPVVVKDHGTYLYLSYASDWPLSVSMYKGDVRVYNSYLMSTNKVGRHTQIILDGHSPSDSYWAPDHYILRVKFNASSTQYSFCVVGSPVILN